MPRTEKRFGVVNQPTASTPTELVPTAATTRNLLINATARTSATISAAIYSGAYSNDLSGNIALTSVSNISPSVGTTTNQSYAHYSGRDNVYITTGIGNNVNISVINPSTGVILYNGNTNPNTGANYWRQYLNSGQVSEGGIAFKQWATNNTNTAKTSAPYVLVSSTKGIAIAGDATTSTLGNFLYDSITISHTVGTSITEATDGVGARTIQGTAIAVAKNQTAGAYALQDGVGYLLHSGGQENLTTSGYTALGMYIYSPSSTAFSKVAIWDADGTAGKTFGQAMSYFIASAYNSVSEVFAFSQPSTTTLWSGATPSASASFPAGYALPSAAAPAGFRIVSNSNTVAPTDTNFLTGTITYPAAPTGVTVPTGSIPVTSIKFSPDGSKVAVAYRRHYSGTGDTNSVVVVYTKQVDGSWLHTHSSGSKIPYQPDHGAAMTWTGDGSSIAIHGTSSSTSGITVGGAVPFTVYLWNVTTGSASISNASVSTWTVAASKYPDFSSYIKPVTESSVISSSTVTSYIVTPVSTTSSNKRIGSLSWLRSTSDSGAGSIIFALGEAQRSSDVFTFGILQASGTVGTTGVPATNYVTTVVGDLPLVQGQTKQVSNIVIGSGERIYVESSASNAVDISAHGVEST